MNGLKILNHCRPPEVEQILPDADVARAVSFPGRDVGKRMFHGRASAELDSTCDRLLKFAELLLSGLVQGDGHGSPTPRSGLRTVGPERARATFFRVEFDSVAWLETLHLARGARDRVGAQVDLEVALTEKIRGATPHSPRLGENRALRLDYRIDERAVHVGPIDVKFDDPEALTRDVRRDRRGTLFLRTIRRSD